MEGTVKLAEMVIEYVQPKETTKQRELLGGLFACVYCKSYNRGERKCSEHGWLVNPQDVGCKRFQLDVDGHAMHQRKIHPWAPPGRRTCLCCGVQFARASGVALCIRYGVCSNHATELAKQGIVSDRVKVAAPKPTIETFGALQLDR